jgi:two-component system response regulator AtoC
MRRVLVVNDDDTARQSLQLGLRAEGYDAEGVASPAAARRALQGAGGLFDFVVCRFPAPAITVSAPASDPAGPAAPIVLPLLFAVLPAGSDAALGLGAMSDGAHDFVVDSPELPAAVALALRKAEARIARAASVGGEPAAAASARNGRNHARRHDPSGGAAVEMIGASPELAALLAALRRMSAADSTVLVRGESGTGKELVARALHQQSPRAAGPFVAVNCGAIPAGLMESELFGHRKGAFTDALRDRQGLLEQASGGTLFLDEIAELPLPLQVKLLRVLEDDSIRRLGDVEDTPIDVRLVAATARDLEAEVAAGRFREDLYYRLNVLALRLPPLRQRAEDIPLLAAHFAARVSARLRLGVRGIAPEAMRVLRAHAWPGNVRELENTIERAAVMCEGGVIDVASLPERVRPAGLPSGLPARSSVGGGGGDPAADLSIKRAARRAEEELIRRALAQTAGNRTRAAELLEISHRALLYKIKEYGVFLPMTQEGARARGGAEGENETGDRAEAEAEAEVEVEVEKDAKF